jgi:hypothetical protein
MGCSRGDRRDETSEVQHVRILGKDRAGTIAAAVAVSVVVIDTDRPTANCRFAGPGLGEVCGLDSA